VICDISTRGRWQQQQQTLFSVIARRFFFDRRVRFARAL
jgi:hypothetical protein